MLIDCELPLQGAEIKIMKMNRALEMSKVVVPRTQSTHSGVPERERGAVRALGKKCGEDPPL